MSEEKMTAEQAWADVARLYRIADEKHELRKAAESEFMSARTAAHRAAVAARAIGPRPVKAACKVCGGSGVIRCADAWCTTCEPCPCSACKVPS